MLVDIACITCYNDVLHHRGGAEHAGGVPTLQCCSHTGDALMHRTRMDMTERPRMEWGASPAFTMLLVLASVALWMGILALGMLFVCTITDCISTPR
jgi:hypothetical protein